MLKRNALANFLGQVWASALGLIFVPIYVDLLGLEAYGLVGLFAVLSVWFSQFDVGMTPTVNREMARFRAGSHDSQSITDLLRTVEWFCAILGVCVLFAVQLGAGYLSSDWVKVEELTRLEVSDAIRLMGLVLTFQFAEGIYRGALLGLQRQVSYNIVSIVFSSLKHFGAWFVVATISRTIEAFFAWQAVIAGTRLITMVLLVHWILPKPPRRAGFSKQSLRQVWRFSVGMLGITALAVLLTQVDKLLLSRLLPLDEFGLYTLATTAVGVLALAIGPILQAIYPRLVELVAQENNAELSTLYHQASQIVTVLAAPPLIILVFFPSGVLFAWTKDIEIARNGAFLLAILGAGTYCNILMRSPYLAMLAYGWTRLSFQVNVVAVALVIPALVWTVPRYGAVGAAWIWLGLNLGYILVIIQLMHRRILIGQKWRWYYRDVVLPILPAILVGFAATLFSPDLTSSRATWAVFFLGVAAAVSIVSFAASTELRSYGVRWLRQKIGSARA